MIAFKGSEFTQEQFQNLFAVFVTDDLNLSRHGCGSKSFTKHSLKICGLCSCQERVKEAETLVSRCKRERVLELRRLTKRLEGLKEIITLVTAFERFKATTTVLQYLILNSPWRRLLTESKNTH